MTKTLELKKTKSWNHPGDYLAEECYEVIFKGDFIGLVWKHISAVACTDPVCWMWKAKNKHGVWNQKWTGGVSRKHAVEKLLVWVFSDEYKSEAEQLV